MSLVSTTFLIFAALLVLACHLSQNRIYRSIVLLAANAIFIGSCAAGTLSLVPIVGFIGLGYIGVLAASSNRSGVRAALAITSLVALFIWLKHYSVISFIPALPFAYALVGISYMLFRIIHLIIEVRDRQLAAPSFVDYFVYVSFCLSFVSGPIQRYKDFESQLRLPTALDDATVFAALGRIVRGYIKVALVGELLHSALAHLQGPLLAHIATAGHGGVLILAPQYAAAALAYVFYLYANFSGYMDLVIGVAALIGIRQPENFHRPWLAANFLDFWSRWHITLSQWFRDYFFNPMLKGLIQRWPASTVAPYLAVVAFFATFLVLGAWHGASSEFILCGVLFGAGVSINQLYQVQMTRWLGKRHYQTLARRTDYRILCRGLTLAYYTIAMTTFWLSSTEIFRLVAAEGIGGLALGFGLLTAITGIAATGIEWLSNNIAFVSSLVPRDPVYRATGLGFLIFLVIIIMPWVGGTPTFVYQAF